MMRPIDRLLLAANVPDTVAYVRVSKEEQARPDKTSLAHQHARIVAKATTLGRVVGQVFEDAGVSGGTAKRPAFQALLRFCAANPRPEAMPGVVLVYNDSRWGRFPNPEESAFWRVTLDRCGWKVRYAEGDDSTDLTVSSIQRALYGSQATVYRETIKANALQGARGTAAQGFWQNEAPIGYRRQATSRTGKVRTLEIGERKALDERVRLTPGPEDEVALVRWLFERYAAGALSLAALAAAAGTRCPSRRWGRTTVHAILKNPAYLGDVVWMRRSNELRGRVPGHCRDEREWVRTTNAHPALVDRTLFDRVQAILARNRRATARTDGGYPLSGLITCRTCGCPYIGGGGPKGPPSDPDRYRFYREATIERHVTCPGPIGTVVRRFLEPLVIRAVGQVVAQPSIQALIAEEFDRVLSASGDAQETRRAALLDQQAKAIARRDRLLTMMADGLCTDAEARQVLAECRARIETTTADLEQLRFEGRRAERLTAERDRLVGLATDFSAQAARMHGGALRELLRPWVQRAVLDKGKRTLMLEIRRIPAEGAFLGLSTAPGQDSP